MSSDISDNNKFSPDESSFDKKKEVIGDNKKEKSVYDDLENNKRGVQLEIEKYTFEPK